MAANSKMKKMGETTILSNATNGKIIFRIKLMGSTNITQTKHKAILIMETKIYKENRF